jgi:hypothetical protein
MTSNRAAVQLGNQVSCFQRPNLAAPAAGAPFDGQTLAAFCAAQWDAGSIVSPPPGPAPSEWVACEADDQGVDVFPGSDPNLCEQLGLQPLPGEYYDLVRRYSAMESDLWSRFPESGCMPGDDAATLTREVLTAHGYGSWDVVATGFGPDSPCALAPDLDPVQGVATIRGGVRPELTAAVQRGLVAAHWCGPEDTLIDDVRTSLSAAGFPEWSVRIDHDLTDQWPCVAGFNEDASTRSVILVGHSSG